MRTREKPTANAPIRISAGISPRSIWGAKTMIDARPAASTAMTYVNAVAPRASFGGSEEASMGGTATSVESTEPSGPHGGSLLVVSIMTPARYAPELDGHT